MSLASPLVNGSFTSYADIIFRVGVAGGATIQLVGVTSIDYDDDLKRAAVYGTQTVMLGYTNGKYEAHGSVTMLLNAANLMLNTLAVLSAPFGGFRNFPINVSVAYATIGPIPTSIDSFDCYLGKQDAKNKVGDEPTERTFALYVIGAIKYNGVPAQFDLNSTLAVA